MKSILKKLALFAAASICLGTTPSAKADILDTDVIYEGQTVTYTVRLYAGQYVSYGVRADYDGWDVDLVATTCNGVCLDSDFLDDACPVVTFVAPYTGAYKITVVMEDATPGVPAAFQLISL